MRRDASLPFRCVKTNRPADFWLLIRISRVPAALRWTRLYRIAVMCGEIDEIRVGVCAEQMRRRQRLIIGALMAAILGAALLMAGCFTGAPDGTAPGGLVEVGIAVILIAAVVGVALSPIVRQTRITSDFVWLAGVHPDFLAALPSFTRAP